jgi:hypothetical protein
MRLLYLERSVREEITEFWLSELFNKNYLQVVALKKVISDFTAAGVSLLHPEMFTEIESETNKGEKKN